MFGRIKCSFRYDDYWLVPRYEENQYKIFNGITWYKPVTWISTLNIFDVPVKPFLKIATFKYNPGNNPFEYYELDSLFEISYQKDIDLIQGIITQISVTNYDN